MIFLKKFYSFSGTLHIVFRAGHTSHMFDFLSFDPAPARRDFSEAVEKSFGNCADFESRALSAGGVRLMLFYLDGCVSAEQISKEIVRPVSRLRARSESALLEAALGGGVWACTVRQRSSPADAVSDIAAGYAALVFDGERTALTFEVRTGDKRSVDAPTVEKSVLGAKDAFVESVRVNTALLRRRVGKPTLKLWETVLGSETKTRVDILYIEGAAAPEQVERVKARLSLPDIPAVLAAGDVEQYLAPSPRSACPQVIHTERPDRFVLGLARGKVGVLCDGLPIGFLLPATLPDMLRVQEDRARHAAVATALVLLRYLALFLSLTLPALYVAVAMYHQEMIPYKLLQSVIDSKQSVPFSTAVETLGMLLSFELLQEAGIRLPDPVGQTVSVIGALIVGQSAVEAKVLSPIVIIVVAMAGIAGYAQPSQELGAAVRLWRVALVLGAVALGFYGVMAGLMLLLWRLCDMENLGVSYLSPLTDSRPGSLRRALLRRPLRKEDRK